jgi:primase-polymerase (primpol)-like protein
VTPPGLDTDRLLPSLLKRAQWIVWRSEHRDGKCTKVPLDPATKECASVDEPSQWVDYQTARHSLNVDAVDGLGFVFTDSDPFVGVDLDDCRNPITGELSPLAYDITTTLHSYTEVSPSGLGVHVLATGDLPGTRRRRGSLEVYDDGRFFTITGQHLDRTPETLCDCSDELAQIHDQYLASDNPTDQDDGHNAVSRPRDSDDIGDVDEGNDAVVAAVVARAQTAANGETFEALWRGDTSGYPSQSEADMALSCFLAYWTNQNPGLVDACFRESGLMREKWDTVHYADGSTYGERTIERALSFVD